MQHKNKEDKFSSFFTRIPSTNNCFIIQNSFSPLQGSKLIVTNINIDTHTQTRQTFDSDEFLFLNPEILLIPQTDKYYLYSNIATGKDLARGDLNSKLYFINLDTSKQDNGKIIQAAGSLIDSPNVRTRSKLSYIGMKDSFIYAVFHYSILKKSSSNGSANGLYFYEAPSFKVNPNTMGSQYNNLYYENSILNPRNNNKSVLHSYRDAGKINYEAPENRLRFIKFDTSFKMLSNSTIKLESKENFSHFSMVLRNNTFNEFILFAVSYTNSQLSIFTFTENGLRKENKIQYGNPQFTYKLETGLQHDASNFYTIFSNKNKLGIVRININALQEEE